MRVYLDRQSYTLGMPGKLYTEAMRAAGLSGLSLAEWIRQAIREKLERDGD